MNALINRLPITRIKLLVARVLFYILKPIYGTEKRVIERNGIKFEIDLSEGLDFSLFLFGNYQKHVSDNKYINLKEDSIILDVGANVGIMSLNFALKSELRKVFAFEPTHYAFNKIKRNLDLNPELARRIIPIQTFISAKSENVQEIKAFSSWKINKKVGVGQHPVHGGKAMSTEGVPTISIDTFVKTQKIQHVDFIKIDTDGNEFEVLKGARETISAFKPKIIFELGQYVMEEKKISFMDYWRFFDSLHYQLSDAANNNPITIDNFSKMIPRNSTIDVLGVSG